MTDRYNLTRRTTSNQQKLRRGIKPDYYVNWETGELVTDKAAVTRYYKKIM